MGRRNFLIWLSVGLVSFVSLATNLLNKIFLYIIGPKLTKKQEVKLINKRIESLERNTLLQKLREERLLKEKIFVCNIKDLHTRDGISFIDFNLKPALAFKTKDGEPILISSVCTHLGCTIQNKTKKEKLFCPCHMSYFDINTGKPIRGPATDPLPLIPHVVENEKLYIIKNA